MARRVEWHVIPPPGPGSFDAAAAKENEIVRPRIESGLFHAAFTNYGVIVGLRQVHTYRRVREIEPGWSETGPHRAFVSGRNRPSILLKRRNFLQRIDGVRDLILGSIIRTVRDKEGKLCRIVHP